MRYRTLKSSGLCTDRRIWRSTGLGLVLPGLALLALSACSGNPKYYEYNPNANSNEWPYRVQYCVEKMDYDPNTKTVDVVGIFKPDWPISNCSELGPSRIHHRFTLEVPEDARDATAMEDHETFVVPYQDATPISAEEYDEAFLNIVHSGRSLCLVAEAMPDMEDATLVASTQPDSHSLWLYPSGGDTVYVRTAPPYTMVCGGVVITVPFEMEEEMPDGATRLVTYEKTLIKPQYALECGACGESRCGDGICDPNTEDEATCPEDCYDVTY